MKWFLLILCLTCFASCKIFQDKQSFYQKHFEDKWEGNPSITYKMNGAGDLVLAVKSTVDMPKPTFDYSVYSLESEEEIFKSGFIGSSIDWLNDWEIIIKGTSRIENEGNIIINVLNGNSRTE